MKKVLFYFFFVLIFNSKINAGENIMIMKLKDGNVEIELFKDVAPNHVKRFETLSNEICVVVGLTDKFSL